jgi:hypothetical protein
MMVCLRVVCDTDIGMTLELLSPLFPPYFFALACAGSFCKSIVGVAGGATRAAITMHQARADNMAGTTQRSQIPFHCLLTHSLEWCRQMSRPRTAARRPP